MNVWLMRLLGIAIVLVAAYSAYLASHEPAIELLCLGAAAAVAALCVVLLWERPKIGSLLAAVAVVVGFAAHAILLPRTAAPRQTLGVAPAPSGLPSLQPASGVLSAPQPGGFDYSDVIGHGTIDDGLSQASYVQHATHAVGLAAAAFGGPTPTPLESATAQKLLDAEAKLPESEYSLFALAQTLPNDPVAIYRFVRDNIATDPYDGIMRGPLGTWMSRAGSPSDKLSLLAWLLVNKHVPIQFVRSTLSEDERNRIVASALSMPTNASPQPSPNPTAEAAIDAYVKDGQAFAQWSSRQLASSNVSLGNGNTPQVSEKHYWIQIDQSGKLLDLDPTLPDMNEGQHLGTFDPTFKIWAMLPPDEWHSVRILLTASFNDGSQQQVVEGIGKTCDLAYTPIRLALTPAAGGNFSDIPGVRKLNVWLVDGSSTLAPEGQLDLDAHGGILRVTMEIDRKDSDGHVLTSTRNLLSPGLPQQRQGPALVGLTSMLVVPGLGLNAFEMHAFLSSMAALTNAIEGAQGDKMQLPQVYPIPLAEYFASDENVANALAEGTNGRFYRNRPNVVIERTWYATDRGSPRPVLGFDIVDNSMAVVGMDGAQAAVANLARGYADTKIEGDVIRSSGAFGTIALFKAGGNPEVIAAGGSAPAQAGSLADGLSETLSSGHVAIAPSAPVTVSDRREYGWWDIDPVTGSAVGRMTGGAGTELTEYGFMLRVFGLVMEANEVLEMEKECGQDAEACEEAMCDYGVGSFLLMRTWKHALHIESGMALLGAIAMDVGMEVLAQAFVCGKSLNGGQHGGEHGGGDEPGGGAGGGGPPEDGSPYP